MKLFKDDKFRSLWLILIPSVSIVIYNIVESANFISEITGFGSLLSTISTAIVLVTVGLLLFFYLQSGDNRQPTKNSETLEKIIKDQHILNTKNSTRIADIETTLEKYKSEDKITNSDKQEIINGIIKSVKEETIKTIFEQESEQLKQDIKNSLEMDRISDSYKEIVARLRREITDLRLRSNVNLIIGMFITFLGLYLLWMTVKIVDTSDLLRQLAAEDSNSNSQFIKNLVLQLLPRTFLVIFLQLFAYFFLRLYRDGLSEIKYFQNELTNIESKLTAIELSYMTKTESGLNISIESLSNTERNFILKKGQTTVELERAKSESELTKNIIKTIPDFLKRSAK